MPFLVSWMPLSIPIETGMTFSALPLRVTVIWWVLSSMVAIRESPTRKLDRAPLASMLTTVRAGQNLYGRQRTWVSVVQ